MSREILFRGKRVEDGKWLYGYYSDEQAEDTDFPCIVPLEPDPDYDWEVDPETVGQYTGLTDKNGTKIFEGDICWFYGGDYYSGLWEQNAIVAITDMTDDEQTHYLNNAEYCEVIGNIHDNPELLDR